jgi:hypothetical protein
MLACCLWPLLTGSGQGQGLVAAASVERSTSSTAAFTAVTRPTRVFTVFVCNNNASALWLHVADATSTPANNTRPRLSAVLVPSGGTAGYDFGTYGVPFTNGVTVLSSTTDLTLTNGAASFDVTVVHTPR